MMCNHTVGASLGSFCKSVLRCLDRCFEEAMCFTKNTRNTKVMCFFPCDFDRCWCLFIHGRQKIVGKCCICRFHLDYLHTHISEIHICLSINIWLYQPSEAFLWFFSMITTGHMPISSYPARFWFLNLPYLYERKAEKIKPQTANAWHLLVLFCNFRFEDCKAVANVMVAWNKVQALSRR